MGSDALKDFLSVENIKNHCEYSKQLRLKLSIIKKSYTSLILNDNLCLKRSYLKSVPEEVVYEVSELLFNIKSHELFFESFCDKQTKCPNLRKQFSSEEALQYEIYSMIKEKSYGFCCIGINDRGKVCLSTFDNYIVANGYEPILAIDLFEHTYFLDYGFNKDQYYRCAIERIDLGKIEERLTSS